MDLEQVIRILKEAQGDTARLGLASVDLLLAGQPDEEREKLRTAIEVSAVPHWFDEKILAVLLDPPLAIDAEALAAQLRRLPVVEPFPARGPGAANVHEATRLALRARMKAESPERLRALSTGARACFAGDAAPHTRIEALYHRFAAEPEAAAWECGALANEWDGAGRYEALLGLGVVLDELLQEGLPEGIVRGTALYWLARRRFNYQPLGIAQTRAALEEYQRSGCDWRITMSWDMLCGMGEALRDQGDLPRALDAYRAGLDIQERLAQADPSDTTAQRNVSVYHNKIGDVLRAQGELAGALAEYRASLPVLNIYGKPISGWNYFWNYSLKEIEDRVLAALALVLLLPMMGAIAVCIKLDSRGPVFFRQQRYGFNNQLIDVIKFRTLCVELQDDDANQRRKRYHLKTETSPRVTPLGSILRRTGLDELPQLLNVLKGDMSIVGPRPPYTQSAGGRLYEEIVKKYAVRHKVKPGIFNGWRGETNTEEKIRKRVEYDIDYINKRSLVLDLEIILKTIWVAIKGDKPIKT